MDHWQKLLLDRIVGSTFRFDNFLGIATIGNQLPFKDFFRNFRADHVPSLISWIIPARLSGVSLVSSNSIFTVQVGRNLPSTSLMLVLVLPQHRWLSFKEVGHYFGPKSDHCVVFWQSKFVGYTVSGVFVEVLANVCRTSFRSIRHR